MSWSKQEVIMFSRGYVSCRVAAAKLGCHITTIHRLVYDGHIPTRSVMLVGKTRFLELKALIASQTEQVQRAFKLNDWSDVIPTKRDVT